MDVNRNKLNKDYVLGPEERVLSALDVDCSRCTAACCREGTAMPLSKREAAHMVDAGTQLTELQAPGEEKKKKLGIFSREAAQGIYRLDTDCGNLTSDGKCAVFGEDERPKICSDFLRGGRSCVDIQIHRVRFGKDVFENDA